MFKFSAIIFLGGKFMSSVSSKGRRERKELIPVVEVSVQNAVQEIPVSGLEGNLEPWFTTGNGFALRPPPPPAQGHVAMSEDIFDCHDGGGVLLASGG